MKSIILLFVTFQFTLLSAQTYKIDVDLMHIRRDRVKVSMKPPAEVKGDSALFIMPLVVPGTYAKYDFGRFIEGFKAYDSKGKVVASRKTAEQFYKFPSGNGISKIEYFVNDTWDTPDTSNFVFQPGGSNIDKGRSIVMNNHAFFGYLDGMKMFPYEVTVAKPSTFFGATSLKKEVLDKTHDRYFSESYVKLVDNPIMYCRPDTTSFISGGARISFSVYSPSRLIHADTIASYVKPLARALERFFTKLPTDRYAFLLYFVDMKNIGQNHKGGFGALEHSYSSLYYLPEMPDRASLHPMLMGVMSHEFLHILTPLNIHSEEIEYFDFKEPVMSQHLWLYEGCTEYFANLVQVRDTLMSYKDFMTSMNEKIRNAAEFPDVSFTKMSSNILTPEFKSMYQNVYEKGALIGFLLDIRLNELSKGTIGLRDLMMKLKEKYGPSKPFKDEELFNEIVSLTFPEIRTYIDSCITGESPLPYEAYFKKIGWKYSPLKPDMIRSFGQFSFTFDDKSKVFKIAETDSQMNAFGLSNDDIILKVNEEAINMENYARLLTPLVDVKTDSTMNIEFKREGKVIKRSAQPVMIDVTMKHVLEEDPAATEQAIQLRKRMLNQ